MSLNNNIGHKKNNHNDSNNLKEAKASESTDDGAFSSIMMERSSGTNTPQSLSADVDHAPVGFSIASTFTTESPSPSSSFPSPPSSACSQSDSTDAHPSYQLSSILTSTPKTPNEDEGMNIQLELTPIALSRHSSTNTNTDANAEDDALSTVVFDLDVDTAAAEEESLASTESLPSSVSSSPEPHAPRSRHEQRQQFASGLGLGLGLEIELGVESDASGSNSSRGEVEEGEITVTMLGARGDVEEGEIVGGDVEMGMGGEETTPDALLACLNGSSGGSGKRKMVNEGVQASSSHARSSTVTDSPGSASAVVPTHGRSSSLATPARGLTRSRKPTVSFATPDSSSPSLAPPSSPLITRLNTPSIPFSSNLASTPSPSPSLAPTVPARIALSAAIPITKPPPPSSSSSSSSASKHQQGTTAKTKKVRPPPASPSALKITASAPPRYDVFPHNPADTVILGSGSGDAGSPWIGGAAGDVNWCGVDGGVNAGGGVERRDIFQSNAAHLYPAVGATIIDPSVVSGTGTINLSPSSPPVFSPHHHNHNHNTAHLNLPAPNAIAISTDPPRTPNVYINGLPPGCSDQELFELVRGLGVGGLEESVRSVRAFTRGLGGGGGGDGRSGGKEGREDGKSSGYGFVLFDTIEAAQVCIDTLRNYKDLHPSFSKQVHKIPGTTYARSFHTSTGPAFSPPGHHAQSRGQAGEDNSPFGSEEFSERGGGADESESFRARMSRFKDDKSTNLYIEGLPLSIDEATLTALVSPYHIRSSRLFQTKLSQPPRIIAFVRLETRAAAEEIIERLHGRLVRGWNDPGSRISVRFADTAEQRELRRTERSSQASGSVDGGDGSPARLTIAEAALLNLRGQQLSPSIRGAASSLPRASRNSRILPIGTPYIPSQQYYSTEQQFHNAPVDPSMQNILRTLRQSGTPFNASASSPQFQSNYHNDNLVQRNEDFYYNNGVQHAHNGYTPAEEMILNAHRAAAHQRRSSISSNNGGIGLGVRGSGRLGMSPNLHVLPTMHEEQPQQQIYSSNIGQQQQHNPNIHPAHVNARLSPRDSRELPPHQQSPSIRHYGNGGHDSFEQQQQHHHQHESGAIFVNNNLGSVKSKSRPYRSFAQQQQEYNLNTNYDNIDNNAQSPSLASPALTYSSSPSTLSPSTPFFNNRSTSEQYEAVRNVKVGPDGITPARRGARMTGNHGQ